MCWSNLDFSVKEMELGLEMAQDRAALYWWVSAEMENGEYCIFLTGSILPFVCSVLTTE